MKRLAIIGAGGLAREIAQLARQIDTGKKRWRDVAFIGRTHEIGQDLGYGRVEGDESFLVAGRDEFDVVFGIGVPEIKRSVYDRIAGADLIYPNLAHPSVDLDPSVVAIGQGNVFKKGVIATTNIRIGSFNLFNWHVTVGHDAKIGDFNVINPATSVSGAVEIGDGVLIGTGARILEGLRIASGAKIGAGAVVIRSIEGPGTYVGVPATLVRT